MCFYYNTRGLWEMRIVKKFAMLCVAIPFFACIACSHGYADSLAVAQPVLSVTKVSLANDDEVSSYLPSLAKNDALNYKVHDKFATIFDSYYAAQSEAAFNFVRREKVRGFLTHWAKAALGDIEPQWEFESFCEYACLDGRFKSVANVGKAYSCSFSYSDEVYGKKYGFAVFEYDEEAPSIENLGVFETGNVAFDLAAVIADIAPNLLKTDLDLPTTTARRVAWANGEHESRPVILFTDAKGTSYYYFLGDTTYEIYKVR